MNDPRIGKHSLTDNAYILNLITNIHEFIGVKDFLATVYHY